jgi:hypothetical protein
MSKSQSLLRFLSDFQNNLPARVTSGDLFLRFTASDSGNVFINSKASPNGLEISIVGSVPFMRGISSVPLLGSKSVVAASL